MNAKYRNILSMPVAVTSYTDSVTKIIRSAQQNRSEYVCVSNVHMCMEAFDCQGFNKIVNEADLVVPDGKPLVWGLKGLGEDGATQVRGSDLLLHVCKRAEEEKLSIGLYGGTPDSLDDFITFLQCKFPDLNISFKISPPFRELSEKEKNDYIEQINSAQPRILFVGIGCPKQEKWMAEHRGKINSVMIGVGAAFDFFSGRQKHAPRWMQRYGLEWLFRLCSDPKRLWKRYLRQNPRFIYHFGRQLLQYRLSKAK